MSAKSIHESPSGDWFTPIEQGMARLTNFCALLSGAVFLPLAFYMTIDATSRRLGGPFSGVSDELSSYVLAFGGTWAMASALTSGTHVRIDIMMHLYPPRFRHFLNCWALAMTALIAGILASEAWKLTLASYEMGARSFSLLSVPLVYPQALTAIGFSILTIQALVLMISTARGGAVPESVPDKI